ncbi:MAG: HAMP domain-containing sensor histidine kinase, partial [Gemmatimonadota bacterium]|nr:HAMP domain-containing sensor histidine kinase [Gemmatimonadota bacterium]
MAALVAALATVAEWARAPVPAWAWATSGLALVAAVGAARQRRTWASAAVAVLLVVTAVVVPLHQRSISRLATQWPTERERRIEAASQRLEGDLRSDLLRIGQIAAEVRSLAMLGDEDLFHALDDIIPPGGVETGVALFRPDGSLRAWSGRHRLPPAASGDSLGVRFSPYFQIFETRLILDDRSTVVASLLLEADPALPGGNQSLSERFRQRTEVGLEVFSPQDAPPSGDVFDYEEPTTAGPRVLFSVRPVPPSQGEATQNAVLAAGRIATLAGTIILLLTLVVAGTPTARYLLLVSLLWTVSRTQALDAFGLEMLSAPSLFFRPLPLGGSLVAGPLLLAGFLMTVLGVRLWRVEGRRPFAAQLLGGLLVLGAPFLIRTLGQGITPPVSGVSIPLWLTWETSLLLATAGLVLPAAALLRGAGGRDRISWPLVGAVVAAVAAILGLSVWDSRTGWPDWYTLLWLPALVLVTRPAARWATVLGVALVAGSAAALMTWGAELEGRVELARRDLQHLGPETELLAEPILNGLAMELASGPVPGGAAALLAAWRRSSLDQQGYPVRLELRSDAGELRTQVVLDQLDLPDTLIARMVVELPAGLADTIVPLRRSPGMHYLLLQRLARDTVVVVGLGPRSQLVPAARLGLLLRAPSLRPPAYTVTLSPGVPLPGTEATQVRWRQERWTIRGERTVVTPDGPRQAYASVEMLRPGPLLIRGAMVLLFNVVLLGIVWRIAELLAGDPLRRPDWTGVRRSFRVQLFVTLGAFFVVPVAGFAGWSVLRLNQEARHAEKLVVTQVLRDALAAEVIVSPGDPGFAARLEGLSSRVDAELGLYRGGQLEYSTSEVLAVFGLLPPLMNPDAYHHMQLEGQREAVSTGAGRPGTIGYRSFQSGTDPETLTLATPQSAGDPMLAEQQLDLLLGLLLASLLGVAAALIGARLAARRLSRPVADLRRAALAFGEGRGLLPPSALPPVEFEPVFAAFQKMADNVEANQEAQEEAARVLAWGEMARQVAHEIKNPLTPIRLGIQHLQRVWRERGSQVGPALEETAPRVLAEIDRLDRIARSFSRYGAPTEADPRLEAVDLAHELTEVVPLYRFGDAGMEVEIVAEEARLVMARKDEVKEVLFNLLENARIAGARCVRLRVAGLTLVVEDDGGGIPAEMLSRIFEPRFSS